MQQPEVTCALCNDTGWVTSSSPDPRLATLRFPGPPPVERCACRRTRHNQQRLSGAGLPPKYQHATFENFSAYNRSLIEALGRVRAWADSYPVLPRRAGDTAGRGLVLIGHVGVGKTHLAAALLKQVITTTGCRGLFYTTKDLLRAIRESYDPATQTTAKQLLDAVTGCQLLVLDDLGEERVTDWVFETMNLIVNARYNACLPLICTTNFPDVEDAQDVNGLLFRIGFRMQSRLHEMCEFVTLESASYRDLPPNGTPEVDLARRANLPTGKPAPARAQLRAGPASHDGKADLKWSGGKGGNQK
jgi:DNA replication protein DnaC